MGSLLHHSVDESAERAPHHEAFRFGAAGLSYEELAARSDRLAAALSEEGVLPGDRVAIYMTKSLDLPVAIYGILKAGAAYVPIDPAAPRNRLRFQIDDCAVRHLVTNDSRARQVRRWAVDSPGLECVIGADADDDTGRRWLAWSEIEKAPSRAPSTATRESDLAYIMYTSGSTGVPKGLMHTHRSGRAYAVFSAREYGVRPEDRLGNHSPLHFDMSTFEFLTAPLCGSTTILIPEETTLFPVSLGELIEAERLSFWYSVPLALIQLLDAGEIEHRDLSSLRWILFGGEPFPPKHLARLASHCPHARFSNSYGPAEVNQCTAFHLTAESIDPDQPIPLGTVWSGAEGLVLDEADHPVSSGDVGELVIRSSTMMSGYWARPDLNERAFFHRQNPAGTDQIFYRTGDLVREREDGNLMFLGRKDRQVKIRGYRVELEEVEAVLSSLAGVAEAAAVVLESDTAASTIVAAVRGGEGLQLDAALLRQQAARSLAPYAVPSRIEVFDSLPRTGSGKIDRGRLREQWLRADD